MFRNNIYIFRANILNWILSKVYYINSGKLLIYFVHISFFNYPYNLTIISKKDGQLFSHINNGILSAIDC